MTILFFRNRDPTHKPEDSSQVKVVNNPQKMNHSTTWFMSYDVKQTMGVC